MKHTIFILFFISLTNMCFGLEPELVLRADKHQPLSLPTWSKMPSTTPVCNNSGFATKYLSLFGGSFLQPALMQSQQQKESFSLPFEKDLSISDISLNKNESIFALNYRGGTEGIYSLNEESNVTKLVDKKDFPKVVAMSRPSIVDNKVLFRALYNDGLHTIYLGKDVLLSETADVAYLYLPTSKSNQISFKVGHGIPGEVNPKNPDKILSVYKGKTNLIAEDKELNPNSRFLNFDNSPVPGGNGSVAFIAEHEEHGRSLWVHKDNKNNLIYSEITSDHKLEYFSPSLNSQGDLIFRVIKDKKRSVLAWSHKNQKIIHLMEQGQNVDGNEKSLRVIDRDHWPAFSGAPCINKNGEVFIHAVLESSDTFENKGSGIFKFKL